MVLALGNVIVDNLDVPLFTAVYAITTGRRRLTKTKALFLMSLILFDAANDLHSTLVMNATAQMVPGLQSFASSRKDRHKYDQWRKSEGMTTKKCMHHTLSRPFSFPLVEGRNDENCALLSLLSTYPLKNMKISIVYELPEVPLLKTFEPLDSSRLYLKKLLDAHAEASCS